MVRVADYRPKGSVILVPDMSKFLLECGELPALGIARW